MSWAVLRAIDDETASDRLACFLGWFQKPQVKLAVWSVDLAARIVLRGRGTPGGRVAGIRLVAVATGRTPSIRATIVQWTAGTVISTAVGRLSRMPLSGARGNRDRTAARLVALRAQSEPDLEAVHDAERESSRQALVGCLPALALVLLTWAGRTLVVVSAPQHQTIEQRLAGTVLVRD